MLLVDPSPYLSIFFSFGVVAIGFASWLGGGEETDTEEIQDEDDDFAMDDDFGMDDFDDDFGGMGDVEEGTGGANSTELENRIEDLESEIANVSSTANTVRSENEQISEKVDDVEENVRKLLEIYEMVTRGVNPFVDDVSAEAGLGGDGGSFGLFDDDEEPTNEADEDLDSDIADAEAEDFFDDDAFDDFDGEDEFSEQDEFGEEDEFSDAGEFAEENEFGGDGEFGDFEETGNGEDLDEFDEMDDPAPEEDTDTMEDDDGGGGGTSFEELKAEYESGEADWADEDLEEGEYADSEPDGADESMEEGDAETADDSADLFIEDDLTGDDMDESAVDDGSTDDTSAMDSEEDPVEPSASETMPNESAMESGQRDPVSEQAADAAETDSAGEETGFQFGAAAISADGDGPYLERPPDGYLSDVVMLEWLDFLVDAYDARNAVRAINYYERIGWIGEPMRDHCVEMVMGITDADYVYRDEFGTTDISMADHRRSLGYVEELAGGRLERTFADSLDTRESNGI